MTDKLHLRYLDTVKNLTPAELEIFNHNWFVIEAGLNSVGAVGPPGPAGPTGAPGAGVFDHGLLLGLLDDDHPGYLWLNGRSANQTLFPGTTLLDGLRIQLLPGQNSATAYLRGQNSSGATVFSFLANNGALDVSVPSGLSGVTYTAQGITARNSVGNSTLNLDATLISTAAGTYSLTGPGVSTTLWTLRQGNASSKFLELKDTGGITRSEWLASGALSLYPFVAADVLTLRTFNTAGIFTKYLSNTGSELARFAQSSGILRAGFGTTTLTNGILSFVPPSAASSTGLAIIKSLFTDSGAAQGYPSGILGNVVVTLGDSTNGVAGSLGLLFNVTVNNMAGDFNLLELNAIGGEEDALTGGGTLTLRCLHYEAKTVGPGHLGAARGFQGGIRHTATGLLDVGAGGSYYAITQAGAGKADILDVLTCLGASSTISGPVGTLCSHRIENPIVTATVDVNVGMIIEERSGGTDVWSLQSQGGKSYHVGNLFLGGTTAPTARLHLGAGSTSISPFKLTSGPLLTTAEAGAIEFLTDDFYATITTGPARKKFVLDDGTALTAGRIPFATTNGRLTDDSDLTFATDKLTATKIAISQGDIISGVYTPTRSAEANLDSNVTVTQAQYLRVGNVVTVSGRFTADPTLTATTTSFELSLPIASNIGAAEDLAGTAICGNIVSQSAEIIGVVANDTAQVQWKAGDVTSQTWSYTFTYRII